jgi:hypothetical protein
MPVRWRRWRGGGVVILLCGVCDLEVLGLTALVAVISTRAAASTSPGDRSHMFLPLATDLPLPEIGWPCPSGRDGQVTGATGWASRRYSG